MGKDNVSDAVLGLYSTKEHKKSHHPLRFYKK